MRRGRVTFISDDDALINETQRQIDIKQPKKIYKLRNELCAKYPINHPALQVLFLHACYSGNIKDVNWFLDNELDPNEVKLLQLQTSYHLTDNIGATPLLLTCMGAHEFVEVVDVEIYKNIIQLLLSRLNFDTIKESIGNYMDLHKTFNAYVLQFFFTLLPDSIKSLLANELIPYTFSLPQLQILRENGADFTIGLLGKIYVYKSMETFEIILQSIPNLNFQDPAVIALFQKSDPLNYIAKYYNNEVLKEIDVLKRLELLKKYHLTFVINNSDKITFLKNIATTKNNAEANKNSLKLIGFLEKNGVSFDEFSELPLVQKYSFSKLLFILQRAFKDPKNIFNTLPVSVIAHHILPNIYSLEFYDDGAKVKKQETTHPQISLQKLTRFLTFRPGPKHKKTKSPELLAEEQLIAKQLHNLKEQPAVEHIHTLVA